MKKRICILALAGALIAGLLFFAGCQSPEEIAALEAARASARAARSAAQSPAASPVETAAGSIVTLKSTTGSVQPPTAAPAESAAPELLTESPPPASAPATATAVPVQPEATAADATAQAAAPEASASGQPASEVSGDPYARTPVGMDYVILKLGAEGAHVVRLQQYLAELGYLAPTQSGQFGLETEAAVKALQEKNSLVADGIVGNSTWDLILMSNAIPAD